MRHVAHAYMCAHVCACVCVCVQGCMSVIREIKNHFQDNAISLNHAYVKCTLNFLIYIMWDYLSVLICAGDVASSGASDSRIKLKPSIIT